MTSTLFELSDDIRNLESALAECEDEEGRRILISSYLATEQQIAVKLDGYASLISELQARSDARNTEARRLQDLAKSDSVQVDSLKERLLWFYREHDLKKVETARYRISMVANGGLVPLLKPADAMELPEQYRIEETYTLVKADNDALRAALAAGKEIRGVALGERGSRIQIK